jgi:hypothetical protein
LEKLNGCRELGITLIQIPYWWDKKKWSLIATIHQHRPDIIAKPTMGIPISMERPIPKKSSNQQHT